MTPKLFPIGVGTDICQISRLYTILTMPRGLKFFKRILSPEELRSTKIGIIMRKVYFYQKAHLSVFSAEYDPSYDNRDYGPRGYDYGSRGYDPRGYDYGSRGYDPRGYDYGPRGYDPRGFDNRDNANRDNGKKNGDILAAATYLAGRFAAKEAVMKAYSFRKLNFTDITITYERVVRDKAWKGKDKEQDKEQKPSSSSLQGEDDFAPWDLEGKDKEQEQEPSSSPQGKRDSASPDSKPREPAWNNSPPVAYIKGDGTHEDIYARISISHDGDYAIAFCLAYMKDPDAWESKTALLEWIG
ncbi:hypothetical protein F5Y06DRAFT_266880 [Hypoxylon sp. FL0890]|nr:hypothetical protein F5Y06DRAFT_266880 [Hypoxylon sp. FL0890]